MWKLTGNTNRTAATASLICQRLRSIHSLAGRTDRRVDRRITRKYNASAWHQIRWAEALTKSKVVGVYPISYGKCMSRLESESGGIG